jgi:site-specific recombinase XerC
LQNNNLEQIKFLLGHSSIQTTECYLDSDQEIVVAVNDNLASRFTIERCRQKRSEVRFPDQS